MALAERLKSFLDEKISYYETKKSYVTKCLNPGCGKSDHFYIRKSNGRSICFKCGTKMGWQGIVSRLAGVSYEAAYGLIFGGGAGDTVALPMDPDLFSIKDEDKNEKDIPIQMGLDFFPVETSEEALFYIFGKRGVEDPRLIVDYDIRFQRAMNAVVFPVKRDGIVYGWQARKIAPKEGELRLISSVFNKSHFLLNWDRASRCKKMILVEGPFDCLHVDVPGYGAVASLGKGVSLDQTQLILASQAQEIYLGLDPDASREFYDIVNRLGLSKKCFLIEPPKHRSDFGESSVAEVMEAIQRAIPVSGKADVLSVYFK